MIGTGGFARAWWSEFVSAASNDVVLGIWHSLYSPRSRTSNMAYSSAEDINSATSWQDIKVPHMTPLRSRFFGASGLHYGQDLFYLCAANTSAMFSHRSS